MIFNLMNYSSNGGIPVPTPGDTPIALAVTTDYHSISGATYQDTGLAITIPKTGTYKIKRYVWRVSSGSNMGTALYVTRNGETTQIGKNNVEWSGASSRAQYTEENYQLQENDVLHLYARGTSSYVVYPVYLSACIDWSVLKNNG